VHRRQVPARVRPRVLARDRVDGVGAQRVFESGALDPPLHRGAHAREVQRTVLADLEPEDDRAGVLTDEVVVAFGDGDVLQHDVEEAPGAGIGLVRARPDQRLLEVRRQHLQGAQVGLLGGLFHGHVGGGAGDVAGRGRACVGRRWHGDSGSHDGQRLQCTERKPARHSPAAVPLPPEEHHQPAQQEDGGEEAAHARVGARTVRSEPTLTPGTEPISRESTIQRSTFP